MCVAILTKAGARLTTEQIENGWYGNPDGGGFAYVADGRVHIKRGLMNLLQMQDEYQKAADLYSEDSPFLIHMRVSTSGGITPQNTHPFEIRGGAMIHNGVMFTPSGARAGTYPDRKSDTRVFAEALYEVLQLENIKRAESRILREIGSYNKLAFLYDNKDYYIMNEEAGDWNDDHTIWFSNSSCDVPRVSYRRGR